MITIIGNLIHFLFTNLLTTTDKLPYHSCLPFKIIVLFLYQKNSQLLLGCCCGVVDKKVGFKWWIQKFWMQNFVSRCLQLAYIAAFTFCPYLALTWTCCVYGRELLCHKNSLYRDCALLCAQSDTRNHVIVTVYLKNHCLLRGILKKKERFVLECSLV